MSLTKSAARRRLALFTGSSMAASLLAAVSTAAILAPTTALAANECGVQAGTALIVCPPGTYPSGITYSTTANFNLATSGPVDVAATGMDVTRNGSNSVTLNTTAGAVTGSGGISVVSTSPSNAAVTIASGSVVGGILVEVPRGNVTVSSTSGDIDVRVAQTDLTQTGSSGGSILATGAGNIDVFHEGSGNITTNSSAGTGLTHIIQTNTRRRDTAGAVNATVGSGGLLLDITGVSAEGATVGSSSGNNGGSSVTGLTVQGAGAAVVNVGREEFVETLANDMTGEVIINDHFARLTGAVNLSSLAGGATMNVTHGGAWELSNSTSLTSDEDALFVGEGGFVHTSIWGSSSNPGPVHTLNFGDGDDTLTNEGRILVGVELMNGASAGAIDSYGTTPRDRYEAELILLGLETFENHGEIWMGTSFSRGGGAYSGELVPILGDPNKVWYARGTDRAVDDIVTMPGTTFIGGESGRIFMDINLNYLGSAQSGCDTSFRDAGGNLPAADCINLQNGATEGTIVLSLTSIAAGGRGAFNPNGIVVIDMSDGEGGPGSGAGGAAGQVTLSPEMRFYNPNFGGVLDTGMFMAMPVYDEELMQFKIVGAPSGGAFHQPLMVNGAQQAWRSANASYFERQADLRDTLRAGEERSTGLWMRAGYEKGERDPDHVFSLASGDLTYDNAHDLNVASLTVGGDFLGSSDGENYWVLGGLLGYVRTDIEYQSWTDATSMNGVLLGGYASLVEGPLFIDASLSGLWNRADQILPQAELFRDATLKTDINTLGVQAEAGWRFDLGLARIEPLVNASWARTRPRDFKVPEDDPVGPGNQVMFEEATSARAGVGLRGSTVVTNSSGMRSSLSLTGRYSREFDGEASAAIGNLNPISPVVTDDFGGDFGEVIGGLTVADATGRLSGALNLGTRFGEDYEALTASASFRYQW